MRPVAVLGVGMHKFGRYVEKSLKELALVAVDHASKDAGVPFAAIQIAYVGNAYAGLITGQESVRGQVILRSLGISGIPIVNVENACASGTTAFFQAWLAVASGMYDVALALGVEKLYCNDTPRSMGAISSSADVEELAGTGFSFPVDYALRIQQYMRRHGITQEQIAKVVVKNTTNGAFNPYAQYQVARSLEDVLASRLIAYPLTLLMCAPMGDGAAAAILCSSDAVRRWTSKPVVEVAGVGLCSGLPRSRPSQATVESATARAAQQAFEMAGVGPRDLEVVEVHDAMAPAELIYYEELGLCEPGEAAPMLERGETEIGGLIPVNTGGGLAARGHPVGATGLAQLAELVWQLRGEAGARQVPGKSGKGPRVALAQNAGGLVDGDSAAVFVHVLKR